MAFAYVKPESSNCDYIPETDGFTGSEDLQACRVCLATDTNLLHLHLQSLTQKFKDITGIEVTVLDKLPQHICTECERLLQKCVAFRNKSHQSHVTLQSILAQTPMLTIDHIRIISQTSVTPLAATKTLSLYSEVDTEEQILDIDIDNVKLESNIKEVSDTAYDCDSYEESQNIEIKEESNSVTCSEVSVQTKTIDSKDTKAIIVKKPVKIARKLKNVQDSCSLQDKKNKTEVPVIKKTPVVRSRKRKNDDTNSQPKKKQTKRKLKYNKNTDEYVKEFAEKCDMDVLFLTREQQLQEVESRKESKDYINARFRCNVCHRGFLKEIGYKKHMAYHDPNIKHECDICYVRFPSQAKLLTHARLHRYHFMCRRCGGKRVGRSTNEAKVHFKWHEGFKYRCKHCGKDFNAQSTSINHVREKHTAVRCAQCGESFAGTRALDGHKAAMHREVAADVEKHKCQHCGALFRNAKALACHATCDGLTCGSRLSCFECGEAFESANALTAHLGKHHKLAKYTCERCHSSFTREEGLALHWVRAHTGAPPRCRAPAHEGPCAPRCASAAHDEADARAMCEVCAKTFATAVQLRTHQLTHSGERPFQCSLCPKRFPQKSHLTMHINTHTGERPYKCALCPATFRSSSQKHKHKLLIHTKERRHKCHLCEKTYVVSSDLTMHIRTAHMNLPYPPRKNPRRRSKRDTGAPIGPPKVEIESPHAVDMFPVQ